MSRGKLEVVEIIEAHAVRLDLDPDNQLYESVQAIVGIVEELVHFHRDTSHEVVVAQQAEEWIFSRSRHLIPDEFNRGSRNPQAVNQRLHAIVYVAGV